MTPHPDSPKAIAARVGVTLTTLGDPQRHAHLSQRSGRRHLVDYDRAHRILSRLERMQERR